jgi:hypothetical protein
LPQSTRHSACRLIFDSRRYLAPLRGNGAITTGWATWNRRSNPGAPLVDQLRIPLCPEARCSRRDYHLRGSCWPRSSYQGDGPAPAAASGTQTSRRIVKRHKGIQGQPPMRFDSLSHEALLQRHGRAASSNKQEPWTVLTPQRVATSIEPATGHPSAASKQVLGNELWCRLRIGRAEPRRLSSTPIKLLYPLPRRSPDRALGHDTVSFHGLSVRPRTHDENLKTR